MIGCKLIDLGLGAGKKGLGVRFTERIWEGEGIDRGYTRAERTGFTLHEHLGRTFALHYLDLTNEQHTIPHYLGPPLGNIGVPA